MALRNIVKKGDDVLTKMCRPVEKFDEKLCTLLDDIYETMEDANGVGLAAPQVGLLRRIVVIDVALSLSTRKSSKPPASRTAQRAASRSRVSLAWSSAR